MKSKEILPMVKLTTTTLIVLVAALSFTTAIAAQKGLTRNIISTFAPPDGADRAAIAQKLEITAEQKSQMKEISKRFKDQSSALKKDYQTAYQNVVKLMNNEKPDKSRVNEKLKNFHQVHSKVLEAEVQYWMDLKTILSPAQNLQLWEIFEQSRIRK